MRPALTRKPTPREWALGLAALLVLAGVPLAKRVVIPSITEVRSLHGQVVSLRHELVQTREDLAMRHRVDAEYAKLNDKAVQRESDEVTLSAFLRDVEAAARGPNVTLVHMKPLPLEQAATYKTYRVRLAAAGRLAEVTQFVSDLLNGPAVTGLDSFTIHGVQEGRAVECNLQVWMVQLLPPELHKPVPRSAKAQPSTKKAGGSRGT